MVNYTRSGHTRRSVKGNVHWVNKHGVERLIPNSVLSLERNIRNSSVAQYSSSFTVPNAKCPVCSANVFFYKNMETGSAVFFDELGPPWPKHPCTTLQNFDFRRVKPITDKPRIRQKKEIEKLQLNQLWGKKSLEIFEDKYRTKPAVQFKVERVGYDKEFTILEVSQVDIFRSPHQGGSFILLRSKVEDLNKEDIVFLAKNLSYVGEDGEIKKKSRSATRSAADILPRLSFWTK